MTSQERGHLIARLIRLRWLRGIGAAAALAIALIGVPAVAGVAHEACAPRPSLSPYGFTGTAVRLGAEHRQALVQRADGAQVEVDGGTIGPAVGGDDSGFVIGGNSRPPFLLNDCTATTLLGLTSVSLSPSPSTAGSSSTSGSSSSAAVPSPIGSAAASAELTVFPTSSAHPDFVTGAIFVVIFALLLAVAFVVRVLRRRLHR